MSFSDAEYAGKRKQTRRERFLIEMGRVGPWKGLIALIESHYPRGEKVVRRIHFTGSPNAKQVLLQRFCDGRCTLRDHNSAPVRRTASGSNS
jgi:hypothetical protein